jgi:hypothetical protein
VIECDWNEMIEEACKDECTIGSLEEFSWMWFSNEIAETAGNDVVNVDIDRAMESSRLHAQNSKDSYTP